MIELSATLAEKSAAAPSGGGGSPMLFILMIGAVALFWFMSRRTRKQQQTQADFRKGLEVGDEVMTASGMLGTVVAIDDDAVTLEATPGAGRTRWVLQAISKRVEKPVEDDSDLDEAAQDDDFADDEVIDVPDDLSSLPPVRKDDEPDQK